MNRLLQIPGDHPYVQQSTPQADVDPTGSPGAGPSPGLDRDWLARHHREFDLVHLHFGFEHLDAEQLRLWVQDLDRYGLPLVYTVHDLRNPHQDSPQAHDRHLDVLVPTAAAVLTLTGGAAREIRRRWGRLAPVIAHPYVIEPAQRPTRAGAAGVVGIHLKDLRRNVVEPDRVVEAACQGALSAGGRLRVDLHPGALQRPELSRTRALAENGLLDLAVHERFSDQELATYLAGLDVYVLPHRFGTHSGWLEACRDVGTRIVSPSCGFYADQWDEVLTYQNDESAGFDPLSLAEAVRGALEAGPVTALDGAFRAQQLQRVRDVHAQIYAQVVANVAVAS